MPEPLYRHPSRSEIIELAAGEGHDADKSSNVGSLRKFPRDAPSHKPEKSSPSALDKDVEKNKREGSISSEEEVEEVPEDDPNTVFWDGPNDPQNPMNWAALKKWGAVGLVSAITFLTPLASSMFAPGVPDVMNTFHSTDDMLAGFMVSVYVLGFAVGPLSELYTSGVFNSHL